MFIFISVLYNAHAKAESSFAVGPASSDSLQQINNTKYKSVIEKSRTFSKELRETAFARGLGIKNQVIDYITLDNDNVYFYEISASNQELFSVTPNALYAEESSVNAKAAISTAQMADLPNGVGGRAYLNHNGNILTTTVTTPTLLQMAGTTSSYGYVYSGFKGKGMSSSGSSIYDVEADMGLQFSNSEVIGYLKWNPVFRYYNGSSLGGGFVSPYNQVQSRNGFRPGVDITYSIYRNLNNATRLSQSGYAYCADLTCSTGTGAYYMTSVLEIAATNVSTISSWKFLATLVDPFATGNISGKFSNIKVDSTAYTPYIDTMEKSTITINNNNLLIEVSN